MKSVVIAIGGNALVHCCEKETTHEQVLKARKVATQVVQLACEGYKIVVTHGNGPQVGFQLLLSEAAASLPRRSLDVCDACTQGETGYLLQQALNSELRHAGLPMPVVTVVTQCLVSLDDPAMLRPSKPIGPFYSQAEAEDLRQRFGWTIVMDAQRGYRRVVPSPLPLEIIELEVIRQLFNAGALVIACGGGGIPVAWKNDELVGVEAVIDKDFSSSLLASHLETDLFLIGTDTDHVYVDYKKPSQLALHETDTMTLEHYLHEGQFAAGSMGPKIEAVLEFVRGGGMEAVIGSCDELRAALDGTAGTHVTLAREEHFSELPVRPPTRTSTTPVGAPVGLKFNRWV
jgi:carbamate kinase